MSKEKKLWKGCSEHYTYWSRLLSVAISFVGDLTKNDKLIGYKVKIEDFNKSKLFVDRMYNDNFEVLYFSPVTFEYHDGISSSKLQQLSRADGLAQLEYEKSNESKLYYYDI